jgi:hypothetical protein
MSGVHYIVHYHIYRTPVYVMFITHHIITQTKHCCVCCTLHSTLSHKPHCSLSAVHYIPHYHTNRTPVCLLYITFHIITQTTLQSVCCTLHSTLSHKPHSVLSAVHYIPLYHTNHIPVCLLYITFQFFTIKISLLQFQLHTILMHSPHDPCNRPCHTLCPVSTVRKSNSPCVTQRCRFSDLLNFV